MNKLGTALQPAIPEYDASRPSFEAGPRFIVPVTDPEVDMSAVTRRVWELANTTGARVQFLGLYDDAKHEPGLRRALATMSAMMSYDKVSSEWEILFSRNWIEHVKSRLQAGDVVICWQRQLSMLLQADLDVPIYNIIPEIHPKNESHSSFPAQVAAWLGFIAIIVFFFFLQVEIGHLTKGWVTILQTLSVIGEFGLILQWNNLFR